MTFVFQLADEGDIVIAKMDATANDVPKQYEVKGYVPYVIPFDKW